MSIKMFKTVLVKNKNILYSEIIKPEISQILFSVARQAFHQNYYYCCWSWNLHSMILIFMVVFIST